MAMPDFRIADSAPEHPKLRQAGLAATGLWSLAGGWAMRELTDGWVPEYWIKSWPSGKKHAATLVKVGLWSPETRNGIPGYIYHDWDDYQRSSAQIVAERSAALTRKALYQDADLVAFVKQRDQNQCRYCGRRVTWTNRRGPGGATFDHVIPIILDGPNTEDNIVVACRRCNSAKQGRTPEQAGMTLRPPPGTELEPSQVGTSDVSSPPHPGPVPSLEGGSVGRESSGTEREPTRNARPRCPDHAELPPDQRIPSCGACKRSRLEAEQQAADQAERAAAERAARRELIDACPDCDGNGMREFGSLGLARCMHPELAEVAS
jgi:5-methylcytosine-specific restriction endonuclease McrA